MAITTPVASTALPTPPSTASPATFDARADAFLGALPTFQTQENTLATTNYNNALEAQASATTATNAAGSAAASALAAQTAAGAPIWVSAASYVTPNAVLSPSNYRVYRCILATSGTTDPSLDPTHWRGVDTGLAVVVVSGTSVSAVAGVQYVLTNVAATTVTLPAAPSSGDTIWVTPANGLYSNVIARNGQTIMGLAQDLTIDQPNRNVPLRYLNSDWKFV